ncbi:hypothetical protein DL93DRAFT_2059969 [Clavulina sp. PMI_390]|nr:hypothetical protein DL93DRAFT_2059969 [Clavulina sp. PMI_390]
MSTSKSPYKVVDGSLPISTLLYDREELICSQDSVGLYDGFEKTPGRQNGTAHLTSHRFLYIDVSRPRTNSLALSLAAVKLSESYAGFFNSSAKITLYLKESAILESSGNEQETPSSPPSELDDTQPSAVGWICPVCSFNNAASATDDTRPKCALCGVPRDPLAYAASPPRNTLSPNGPSTSTLHRSPSMPTLRHPIPTQASGSPSISETNACPACTYLNHRSMKYCEVCGTSLPNKSSLQTHLSRSSGSTPAPSIPIALPMTGTIRISFRKGGDKPFYTQLKRALQSKAWDDVSTTVSRALLEAETIYYSIGTAHCYNQRSSGIFDTLDLNARTADTALQGNLHDLEVLMAKAKEMVDLASSLNAKLTAQEEELARRRALFPDLPPALGQKGTQPEEVTFIRSSLAQLGLPAVAVTQDMVKDENAYHEELAKELAGVLTGKNSKGKGKGMIGIGEAIIGLDEVWGGWNRARGVALVPPSSLLMAVQHLPKYTSPPISLRVFRSGLRVLHTPKYGDELFTNQLERLFNSLPSRSATTVEIAIHEHLSVGLAEEMLESAEDAGKLAHDEEGGSEQSRWYMNILDTYEWDGD